MTNDATRWFAASPATSLQRFCSACYVLYLLCYAFEGPLRYGLNAIGQDGLIMLRDALIFVPLMLILLRQVLRLAVHPAYLVFLAIVAVHGFVIYMNFHITFPAIYGIKLLCNVLFGFLLAQVIIDPSPAMLRLLAAIWLATMVGLLLDKFVVVFPWIGMQATIGGIHVDISRGWDIDDALQKRVAGLTRSSISAAVLLPSLALIIAPRIGRVARTLLLAATLGGVFLTTQKGALLALLPLMLIYTLPNIRVRWPLIACCCVFAIAVVVLPIFTQGLLVTETGGVFSLGSFAMRIRDTWPDAWSWIARSEIFPFGVGLGGIGGAQRFFAPDAFNPCDNLFVYLYGNFGVPGLVYLAWILLQVIAAPPRRVNHMVAALGLLAFDLGYGTVLSMLEDQMAALTIGAGAGMLWLLHQQEIGSAWREGIRPALRIGRGGQQVEAA